MSFQNSRSGRNIEQAVLVKKFPRFEDPFCLGKQEKARSLRLNNVDSLNENATSNGELHGRDSLIQSFADPSTPKVNLIDYSSRICGSIIVYLKGL